jgi:hypothetical protein
MIKLASIQLKLNKNRYKYKIFLRNCQTKNGSRSRKINKQSDKSLKLI